MPCRQRGRERERDICHYFAAVSAAAAASLLLWLCCCCDYYFCCRCCCLYEWVVVHQWSRLSAGVLGWCVCVCLLSHSHDFSRRPQNKTCKGTKHANSRKVNVCECVCVCVSVCVCVCTRACECLTQDGRGVHHHNYRRHINTHTHKQTDRVLCVWYTINMYGYVSGAASAICLIYISYADITSENVSQVNVHICANHRQHPEKNAQWLFEHKYKPHYWCVPME